MSLYALKVESLALTISNADGHEHRVRPIAARAAAIFAERLENFYAEAPGLEASRSLRNVNAAPVDVDLNTMTDEHVASSIADAWLEAVALKLR